MPLSLDANPVGVANPTLVQAYISQLEAKWAAESSVDVNAHWWEIWKQPIVVHQLSLFMLTALDALVMSVDKLVMANADKKATVLATLSGLYTAIIIPLLPLPLKPFSAVIGGIILAVLSNLIDFVANKYHGLVVGTPQIALDTPKISS